MNISDTVTRMFRAKTDLELAVAELEEAKRARLQAMSARDYAEAMCQYHAGRIDRLSLYVETLGGDQPKEMGRAA